MSLIELLKQADSCLKVNDLQAAKGCLEKALEFGMDEQTKSVIYEQLSMCCINLKNYEDAMLYLEFLILNEEYEDIYDASVRLAKLYRDTGRLEDMYRIGKKINSLHQPGGLIKQPEQLYYELWCRQNEPDAAELNRQRAYKFKYGPKISIVVPVYNVRIEFLKEMLDSVCGQTYSNWELCLADGNSSDEEIRETIRNYSEIEKRIKYTFLDNNLGISENTNAAISICDGEYIFFVDHDDVLPENALFEVALALEAEGELDFIYSDHDYLFIHDGEYIRTRPIFKPEWNPMLFEQSNYIIHPTVVKQELLNKVGLLRKEHDGWQDTELIFRIADNTKKICHIPKILYHWRMHAESVTNNINFGDAHIKNKSIQMYSEHYDRINIKYKVLDSGSLETVICDNIKVSVIVVNQDSFVYLKRCIESICLKAGYKNYEIIIIDRGSTDKEVLLYYKALEKKNIANVLYRAGSDIDVAGGYAEDYNFGAKNATGDYLVFMSGICEMLNEDWMYVFLQSQQYPNSGLTGCGVNYMDESGNLRYFSGIQLIGSNCAIKHMYSNERKKVILCPDEIMPKEERLRYRNVTALDSACVMISKNLFNDFGGFEIGFSYTFFVFDLCLKLRKTNYYNVWINVLELNCTQEKGSRYFDAVENYETELGAFKDTWSNELKYDDPFMSINFSVDNYEKNDCFFNIISDKL